MEAHPPYLLPERSGGVHQTLAGLPPSVELKQGRQGNVVLGCIDVLARTEHFLLTVTIALGANLEKHDSLWYTDDT